MSAPKTPGQADPTQDVGTLLFHKRPVDTMYYSIIVIRDFLVNTTKSVLRSWIFRYIVVPTALVWTTLAHIEGPHTAMTNEATTNLKFVVWWFCLGVLSSVGLGSGMHTGLIFTFPHVLKVVYTAEHCRTLDFDTRQNMWGNIPTTQLELYTCETPDMDAPMPTFWQLWIKVLAACVIWGIGTAAGEIPPYQFSYMAAMAGEANAELDAELEETKNIDDSNLPLAVRKFNAMKAWMVGFINRHGFWGLYLMASWPNAAFDLCGMCCGMSLMPFWTFFGATVLGKGCTLRPIQAAAFVLAFSKQYRGSMLAFIGNAIPVYGNDLATWTTNLIEGFISGQTKGADASPDSPGYLGMAWGLCITTMILVFLKSAMENFAQQHVREMQKDARKQQ